jgi:hypothetical protein
MCDFSAQKAGFAALICYLTNRRKADMTKVDEISIILRPLSSLIVHVRRLVQRKMLDKPVDAPRKLHIGCIFDLSSTFAFVRHFSRAFGGSIAN